MSIFRRLSNPIGFRHAMPRDFYLPAQLRGTPPTLTPEGTDLAIYSWDSEIDSPRYGRVTRYHAVAFYGKANKPLWNYVFGTAAARQAEIEGTIEGRRKTVAYKTERAEARRTYQHGLRPGSILVTSWGYDQTNVDFYEVVEVRGKTVVVREIGSKSAGERGDRVLPDPGRYVGPPMKKVVGEGDNVKIEHHYARPWTGGAEYVTAFGMGH